MAKNSTSDGAGHVRFAVLEHHDGEGTHYDLLIDAGPRLATWKCQRPPEEAAHGELPCDKIADHRRVYLEYEGPISGDRGWVRRHDEGTCTVLDRNEGFWRVEFQGQRLAGRFALTESADAWSLRADGG